jgi:pimeloyl-ACP methyl ester carboxylesterase
MTKLSFKKFGKGQPLILLHGFPFNKRIWENFASKLSSGFEVHIVDLPGFGASPIPSSSLSISSVAQEMLEWIRTEEIKNSILIGHSLGGYVALSMVEQAEDQFAALGLFHSTAAADTGEKKISRDKTLDFVRKNGALPFTSTFVAQLFADKDHPAIETVKSISMEASSEAVLGYTRAMRDRNESFDVLKKFTKPTLFIAGKEDPGIPVESIQQQAKLCQEPEVQILDNVGHMGMFEAEEKTLAIIRSFAEKATRA